MPAHITIYDEKCAPVSDLGSHSRNVVKYSPSGRSKYFPIYIFVFKKKNFSFSLVLLTAGFGSLQGHIDVWDPKRLKILASCQADCASYIDWSRDSRSFITGVLSPRIRVDNG